MIAYPTRSETYRDRARVFPLAALALAGIGLAGCSGAPETALQTPTLQTRAFQIRADSALPDLEAACASGGCLSALPRAVAALPLAAAPAPAESARDFARLELAMAAGAGTAPASAPASGERSFARLELARAGTSDAADETGAFGFGGEERAGSAPALGQDERADDGLLAYRVVSRAELSAQRDFARLETARAELAQDELAQDELAQTARAESLPEAPVPEARVPEARVQPASDRLQLASAAVGAEELESHRGGFVTVDGIQVDFAFQQVSTLNGLEQITSRITLADMIAGNPGTVTIGGVVTSGTGSVNIVGAEGGVTSITHNVLPSSINTIFANTTNGIDAGNMVDLTIDIVGIDTVRVGHRVGQRPMNLELRNALIHSISN